MTNDKISTTRETLINDTDALKRDAAQIVDDVKKHAYAHVDVVKDRVTNTFDQARDYAKKRPFHVAAIALFIGFFIWKISSKIAPLKRRTSWLPVEAQCMFVWKAFICLLLIALPVRDLSAKPLGQRLGIPGRDTVLSFSVPVSSEQLRPRFSCRSRLLRLSP